MNGRGFSWLAGLCCAAVLLLAPARAWAGFSRAVRLPGDPAYVNSWMFALNDRGQALATSNELVYPVRSSGRLGPPWRFQVPGGFEAGAGSLVLDDDGHAAAGLSYSDRSYTPEIAEHNHGCCAHVAVTAWPYGAPPPLAQVLAPAEDPTEYSDDELSAPKVVIGPKAISALWSAGGYDERGPPFEAHLDEAFGPFGMTLHAVQLKRVNKGIQSINLNLAPNGDPIASWRQNLDEVQTVEGSTTGALPDPASVHRVPALAKGSEEEHLSEDQEFSSDPQGDTLFAYLAGSFEHRERVMTITSTRGHPFSRARLIAMTGPEGVPPTVILGGKRSLTAFWGCIGPERCAGSWARPGAIFGRLRPSFAVGDKAQGFIGPDGRTAIVYEGNSSIQAIVAPPGKPFGRPLRISPAHHGCELGTGGDDEPPIATSHNGHAILYFSCDGGEHEYLVRYSP